MRYYFMDNLRGILILLVVLGHTKSNIADTSAFLTFVYDTIYYVHMPFMIFISGYFSKNVTKAHDTAISKILVPYMLLTVCYQTTGDILMGRDIAANIFKPSYGSWFLLTLFYYRFTLKYMVKIPKLLLVAFVISIFGGFIDFLPTKLAIPRTINYYFFFILGFYTQKEQVTYLSTIIKKKIYLVIWFLMYIPIHFWLKANYQLGKLQKMDDYYSSYDIQGIELLFAKIIVVILTMYLSILLLNCVTSNKTKYLSFIGQNTMTLYVGHLFIIQLFRTIWDVNLVGLPAIIGVSFMVFTIIIVLLLPKWLKQTKL